MHLPHFVLWNGKLRTTKCDSEGRLYLRESIRSRHGVEFVIVETSSGLLLLPVPDDPAADLAELGKKLADLSVKDIKKRLRKRALAEALS